MMCLKCKNKEKILQTSWHKKWVMVREPCPVQLPTPGDGGETPLRF